MTNIDKEDVTWVLWFWEVRFGYSPVESGGGGIVDDAEGVETGDGGGVLDGSALCVGVPSGHGDDDVRHAGLELTCSSVTEFTQIHRDELCGQKGVLLTEIRDLAGIRWD